MPRCYVVCSCRSKFLLPKDAILDCDDCPAQADKGLCTDYGMAKIQCPCCEKHLFSYCVPPKKKEASKSELKPN